MAGISKGVILSVGKALRAVPNIRSAFDVGAGSLIEFEVRPFSLTLLELLLQPLQLPLKRIHLRLEPEVLRLKRLTLVSIAEYSSSSLSSWRRFASGIETPSSIVLAIFPMEPPCRQEF